MREQPLLHHILAAARRERAAAILLLRRQLVPQPRHRPIEMVQIEPLDAGDRIVLAPAIRGPIGAAQLPRGDCRTRRGAGAQVRAGALDLVFMDTTSLYFEGAGGQTLGRHGYSKDHRPDLRQMILAVLLDGEGRPVCSEMWPGNTADVTTLIPVIDRLRHRFAITRVCIVADRGMISAETLAELETRDLLYILGVRERTDKIVRELVLDDPAPFVPLMIDKSGKSFPSRARLASWRPVTQRH